MNSSLEENAQLKSQLNITQKQLKESKQEITKVVEKYREFKGKKSHDVSTQSDMVCHLMVKFLLHVIMALLMSTRLMCICTYICGHMYVHGYICTLCTHVGNYVNTYNRKYV